MPVLTNNACRMYSYDMFLILKYCPENRSKPYNWLTITSNTFIIVININPSDICKLWFLLSTKVFNDDAHIYTGPLCLLDGFKVKVILTHTLNLSYHHLCMWSIPKPKHVSVDSSTHTATHHRSGVKTIALNQLHQYRFGHLYERERIYTYRIDVWRSEVKWRNCVKYWCQTERPFVRRHPQTTYTHTHAHMQCAIAKE